MSYVVSSLDPFTDIVAVKWRSGPITKLDFVNNRYRVAGQLQALADVIDHPEWRGSLGLDLRGSTDLVTPPREVRLINKEGGPSKKIKGARSEFTWLDYTIVIEFDWYNRRQAWEQEHPELIPSGITGALGFDEKDMIFSNHRVEVEGSPELSDVFQIQQSNVMEPVGPHPDHIWYGVDHDYWERDVEDPNLWHRHHRYMYSLESLPGGAASVPLCTPAGDGTYNFVMHWVGSEPPFVGGAPPPWGTTYSTEVIDPPYNAYPVEDAFIAWDATFWEPDWPRRVLPVGASRDTDLVGLRWLNGIKAPWGRNRIALTVTADRIEASVNGGDPFVITDPSKVPMPRIPPNGPDGKPLQWFPTDVSPWKVLFKMTAHLRCVWLFRKKRKLTELKAMSAIAPLPAANSSLWDKPPGQDQPK